MKLLESTVSKINKDKKGENVPNLEVIEVVLVHCNLVNNDYHTLSDYQNIIHFRSKQNIW